MGLRYRSADRVVAERAQADLSFDAVAHKLDGHEESDDEKDPYDPDCKGQELGPRRQGEHDDEDGRDEDPGYQRAALEPGISHREGRGPCLDGLAIVVPVGQRVDGLGEAVFAAGELHGFPEDHVAVLDLAGEELVHARQMGPDDEAEGEGENGEDEKLEDVRQPVQAVESADGLA